MKNEKGLFHQLHMQMKTKKVTFAVYILLRALVIAALVFSIFSKRYENTFVCVLSLILFLVPAFCERSLKITLPTALEVIILLFIFAAEILGEMNSYYLRFAFWDTMLHTINGFLCAAIGFSMVDVLNRNSKTKLNLSPVYLAIVAFCFSMTIGVMWEFFEFGCDMIFKTDMQKDFIVDTISSVALNSAGANTPIVINNISSVSVNGQDLGINGYLDIGLIDTMKDLLVNFVGAVVFSIIGYFYVKNRGRGKFAKHFIPTLSENDGEEDK